MEVTEVINLSEFVLSIVGGAIAITVTVIGTIWKFWSQLRVHLVRLEERLSGFAQRNTDEHDKINTRLGGSLRANC